jgi:hypothetical protein
VGGPDEAPAAGGEPDAAPAGTAPAGEYGRSSESDASDAGAGEDGDAARVPVAGTGVDDQDGGEDAGERRRTALTVGLVTAVLAVPLVIGAIAVRNPRWYPLIDLAQIELRVRDVGTSHPPLVGLGGRIFGHGTQGSHPGPLSFYLLAPVYRLLGGSSWALQVSTAVLDIAALGATVWAAHRRWGLRGALLVGAGLALAMRIWGTTVLLYPWNPYMPVLFWLLFLVCVWGVLCDDLPLVPVAVVAGFLCAQTHIPYTGMVGGLVLVMAGSLALTYRRAGVGDAGTPDEGRAPSVTRQAVVRWSLAGLLLGAVIWAPVIVDEVHNEPGNLSIIVDSFRHSDEDAVGIGPAWDLLVEHVSPLRLLEGDRTSVPVAQWPGYLLLAAWVASVVAAVLMRDRTLVRLHVVVGVALVLGLVSISRILGVTWFYLTLWAFGTGALVLVSVVATAAIGAGRALARREGAGAAPTGRPAGAVAWATLAALVVAVVWPTALLAADAPDTEDSDAAVSNVLGEVVQPTVDAIEDGTVPGGPDGTFTVTWVDPVNLGGQGVGMLLELERRGFDVGAPAALRLAVRSHRVVAPGQADAEIHVATGVPANAEAEAHPGGERIAYHDPRTPQQRAEYDRLRGEIIESLESEGLDDLLPLVDSNFILLASDERAPEDVKSALFVMGRMPQPLGVYAWSTE